MLTAEEIEIARDPYQLAEPLGSVIRFGLELSKQEGRGLFLSTGRRSIAYQKVLRRRNCAKSPRNATHYEIWVKPAGRCNPPTARPGTSKHQRGEAADVTAPSASKRRQQDWLARKLAPFGAYRNLMGGSKPEPWHFVMRPGSDETEVILRLRDHMLSLGWSYELISEVLNEEPDEEGIEMQPWMSEELLAQAVARLYARSREGSNFGSPTEAEIQYWVAFFDPVIQNGQHILDECAAGLKKEPGSNLE